LTIKAGQELKSLGQHEAGNVMQHPAQQATAANIAELISWLRSCEKPSDYYEFQRHLFGYLYAVEERRAQCSRIIKRLRRGQSLPADAPAPPYRGDPSQLANWEFEAYVYERLARQLRTVGDGLAWRCLGYDRRMILALSRNESAGPMYGKAGLPYELGRITELWKQDGHFALHHDLTNCLRIADLTEFTDDGGALLREIKAKPHTEKKQMDRAQAAVDAIMHGGPLPGDRPDARLIELTEPYVTNLKQLVDLIQLAKRHGCRGMKLSQGRALMASSLPTIITRWGHDPEEGTRVMESTRQRAIKRAGIDTALHHIKGYSGDTASRSPIMAPWSIYPFSPVDCACLTCDLVIFETTVSAHALVESLERAGLRGELLLANASGQLGGDMGVVRAHWRNRAMTWHAHGLNLLLYELAEPDTLARGMGEVLLMDDPPSEPVMVYAREAATWLPKIARTAECVIGPLLTAGSAWPWSRWPRPTRTGAGLPGCGWRLAWPGWSGEGQPGELGRGAGMLG
jgi:hypothetical protein